ncbi:MAG: hypothetical protein ACKVP0_08800 [Pirellulaceae bacterium]
MFQFSLRNLLVAVAFFALGAAALVNAGAWWSAITWATALLSLVSAGLLAMHRREEQRAFWGGNVLFGTLYVLLLMYSIQPTSSSNSSVLCLNSLSYFNLLTTKLANWSYSFLPTSLTTEYFPGGSGGTGSSGPSLPGSGPPMSGSMPGPTSGFGGGMPAMPAVTLNPRFVTQTAYLEVAHALWIILLATLGGALSAWFYKTRQQPRS